MSPIPGVTMALIHGGQPDALILCHEPTRAQMRGLPDYTLPSLEELRDTALPLARVANPGCVVAGVSVNTQHMSEEDAKAYLAEVESSMDLPATDPFGSDRASWWTRWPPCDLIASPGGAMTRPGR